MGGFVGVAPNHCGSFLMLSETKRLVLSATPKNEILAVRLE